ncbi:MAG TPA: Gfo/Idh/MocA family oxidoreductase [Acidobacteriota bacterium]|nr:Gfo/Idh/MocA family oxidoreductase [Acidobacteriota bacterium]
MSESKNKPSKPNAQSSKKSNRRQFLAASGAALAGAAGASRLSAASYERVLGANDRINVGVIGTGGMGTAHVGHISQGEQPIGKLANADVTAVCDVYQKRREYAAELGSAKPYLSHEDLLASNDVDAVIIASPEHWHYRHTVDALHAGKDVYLQKPMTRTFEEAKSLYELIKDSDMVFQLGSQYFQAPNWKRARQLFQQGLMGHVTISQTSYCRNNPEGEWNYDIDEEAEPGKNLDWNRFLGSLPYVDYDPEYYFRWRKYRRFSGGIITDLLPHQIHCLSYVLGAEFPRKVSCIGGQYLHHDRTVGDTTVMTVEFESSTMIVAGSTINETGLENLIRGHRGNMFVAGNSVRMVPERVYAEEFDPVEERLEPAEMGENQVHVLEWLNCIREGNEPTWSVEPAFKVMTAVAMAEESYFSGRTLHFDPETLEVS